MPGKNRSAGITAIAILAFIGSALLLGLAALVAFAMIVSTVPPPDDAQLPPMFFKMIRIVIPLFYVVPAIWGIVTAVGLLQLRNWARISTIVFSALLIVFGGFGLLAAMAIFLKPPPGDGLDPKMFSIIGAITAVTALAQIGIGIWWMVFFNRAKVKTQFLTQPPLYAHLGQGAAPLAIDMPRSATPPPPGLATPTTLPIAAPKRTARPVSISIIAWFLLISCLFVPLNIVFHAPAVLFTTILTGWPAAIYVLVYAALNVYIGIALLQMKPAGRLVGIGYFLFGLLNVAVFYFAPGRSARIAKFLDIQQSMFPWMRSAQANSPFQIDMMPFLTAGAVGGVIVCLVLVYLLAAAKPAFDKAVEQVG